MTSYCSECRRAVAREDRVKVDGRVYHRQCAPDDATEHRRLDEFRPDGGTLRGVTPADDLERHLQVVLDEAGEPEVRRHAREGLQYLQVLDEAAMIDGRGSE